MARFLSGRFEQAPIYTTKSYKVLLTLLGVILALFLALCVSAGPSWAQTTNYVLKASTQADRSGAVDLQGQTASGNIYVFTSPDSSNISQVAFYFDDPNMAGTPKQVESVAPYDFAGGSVSTANPFNTTTVADGSHTITAKLTLSDGTTKTTSSTFTVKNGTSPPPPAAGKWETRASSSQNRQEVSYVKAGGKFYLAGGSTLHESYDPATDSWSTVKPLPANLDHIQGVEVDGLIYYIGGLSSWPGPHVNTVYIYDPSSDTFSEGTPMPTGRGRGAGGVAVHNGKIYYAGGLNNGKAVAWFDVYDPKAKTWTQLPDMPRVRDHFQAAVVDGKFYAIGGRDTQIDATNTKVDVYDLSSGTGGSWQTPTTDVPTARGGFAAAVLGKEILIIGGEGGGKTYNNVEAYDTASNSWRTLAPMPTARHGIQAVVCSGGVYVAAGGKIQGGGGATNVHEAFFLNGSTSCSDSDTTAPTVSSVTPANSATNVAANTNVEATFSEAMNASTITSSTFTLTKQGSTTPLAAAVSYDSATKKATLNPNADLEAGATYTATIKSGASGVKDTAGNALAQDKTWSFTVASSTTTSPGLKGEYYDNLDFTNLKLTRTDSSVNFSWGSGSPDPAIGNDTFSVRWTGQVKADYSQAYTFYVTSNDGNKLWVNGVPLTNRWVDGSSTQSGTINLTAGQWYDITLEYYEGVNTAQAKLEYSSPSEARKVIPSSNLRTTSE